MTIFLDTETFSVPDIKKTGAGPYFAHPEFEVLICTFAANDWPVECIDFTVGEGLPDWLVSDLNNTDEQVVAHNYAFDMQALIKIGLYVPDERWLDTAALARAAGLPGDLDGACKAAGVPAAYQKKAGGALINRFCSPAPKNHKADRYTRETHPAEWEQFKEYARFDIESMRGLYKRLPDARDI